MITKKRFSYISGACSRNLGQHSVLAKKGTFLKKRHQKFHPTSYSIPFLSVLHQNKVLYNFHKRGQHLIVEHNIGLEYALIRLDLLVASETLYVFYKTASKTVQKKEGDD